MRCMSARCSRTFAYWPNNNTWKELAPMRTAASAHSMAVFDGHIYKCGGRNDNDGFLSACERLPVATATAAGQWMAAPSLRTGRGLFVLVTVGDRLLAIGGLGDSHHWDADMSSVEALLAGAAEWTPLHGTAAAWSYFGAAVVPSTKTAVD